jgi:prophage tail gpP-like protein
MKPVVISIGGSELTQWTEMKLTRKKEDLTGTLDVTIFGGGMPSLPMLREAWAGQEITVYISGQLAFTGTLDARKGTGAKKGKHAGTKDSGKDKEGKSLSLNLGPNEYTIKLSARGKTKRLMDSAHQHPTTNMMQPTTKEVVEKLIEPWKIQVDWKGEVIKLDKMRFRDGARVIDELHRVGKENCYFMYETRDGKLRVTDGVGVAAGAGAGGGDPLILGQNILEFSAEQSEHEAKSKIKVKGQRTKKNEWGEKALLKTFKIIDDKWVKGFVPETVQHNGDADEKTLERRARFEANKHSAKSKKVEVTVFHVQTPSGAPWDIGDIHYVEIPPEGIFDVFEVIELEYHVDHEKTIKTKLTLSPPPSGGTGGSAGGFGLANINSMMGAARASQAGFSMASGSFPAPWSSPMLGELPLLTLVEEAAKLATKQDTLETAVQQPQTPPLTLPPWFGGKI